MNTRLQTVCVLCSLCVLGSVRGAAGAVDDYLGKPIASVRLVVEGRESADPALLAVVETAIGQPLDIRSVRETIAHLFSLGRFDDIRVDASPADGTRVALRYDLSPVHPVTKIEFEGSLGGLDVDELRTAVSDRFGASSLLGRVDDLKQTLGEVLRERGYLHADIKPRADIHHDPDRATLVFAVQPGPRTTIGTIDVAGLSPAARAALISRLDLAPGRPYQRDALNARIERYLAERRKAGYYEARIVLAPQLAEGDRIANLTLDVTQGPHVRVAFRGDPLPIARRAELVPVEREGSVDEDLLEDSTNRIEDYLRAEGYRDAKAPHARETSGDELLVTFTVSRGPQYRVDRVEISGNASVPLSDFEAALRLRDGEPFAETKLDADVAAIEDLYRRRGFASVAVRAAEEGQPAQPGAALVSLLVRVVITEGPSTTVAGLQFQGNTAVSSDALTVGLWLQPGRPYLDSQLLLDRDLVQQRYVDLGYPNVTVDAAPNFNADRTSASPIFTIREGVRAFIDHVLIIGNVRTGTSTIARELQFKPGDPLSESAKIDSRRRLAALGLFRRVQIAELGHGDETQRDILVTVEESPVNAYVVGGGVESRLRVVRSAEEGGAASEGIEILPRGSFEISRRNLFGKNRTVSLFTSVSVRLQKQQVFTEQGNLSTEQFAAPEYRVLGTYREPKVFDTEADALVTGTFEQQARASFSFARRGASAEIARQVTRQIGVSASYQIQRTRVFDFGVNPADQRLIDRLFPQVRLSSASTSAIRDTRNDLVDPGAGEYLSANVQLAGRRIGSEVGFAKTFLRAQLFRTVPAGKRLVFAGNASLGMATGFAREVVTTDAQGVTTVQTVEDLPASERFFAGGDSTVRGFSPDTLGTAETIDKDGFPIGGNATMIFNAELRATMWPTVQAVGFFDTGNVYARTSDLALNLLRHAVGFGVRYLSPVGPIRVDLGFKTHREDVAGRREGLTAFHVSLGHAF